MPQVMLPSTLGVPNPRAHSPGIPPLVQWLASTESPVLVLTNGETAGPEDH